MEVETVTIVVERLDSRLVVLVTVYGIVVFMDDVLLVVEVVESAEDVEVADMQSVA